MDPEKTWRDLAASLDPPSATLVRTLFTSANRRLFLRRNGQANHLAWNVISDLCDRIAEAHGLARLPTVPIAFRSTPAPQCSSCRRCHRCPKAWSHTRWRAIRAPSGTADPEHRRRRQPPAGAPTAHAPGPHAGFTRGQAAHSCPRWRNSAVVRRLRVSDGRREVRRRAVAMDSRTYSQTTSQRLGSCATQSHS